MHRSVSRRRHAAAAHARTTLSVRPGPPRRPPALRSSPSPSPSCPCSRAAAHAAVWVIPATTGRSRPRRPATPHDRRHRRRRRRVRGRAGRRARGRGARGHGLLGAGSDALITDNTKLPGLLRQRDAPTTDLGTKRRLLPRPARAAAFGKPIDVPGDTAAFYLLAHVPPDTPPGDYRGDAPRAERRRDRRRPVHACTCGTSAGSASPRARHSREPDAISEPRASASAPTASASDQLFTASSDHAAAARHHAPCAHAGPRSGGLDAAGYAPSLAPYLGADGLGSQTPSSPGSAGSLEPSHVRGVERPARTTSPRSAASTSTTAGRRRPTPT